MPDPNVRPYSDVLIPFSWAFYYLKNDYSFENALRDILSRGGDTRANTAVVGGMIGAAKGFKSAREKDMREKVLNYVDRESAKPRPSEYNLKEGQIIEKVS
jgi:ADP-ribosylglycohydrolase